MNGLVALGAGIAALTGIGGDCHRQGNGGHQPPAGSFR